ncbi:MAG: extracellular solute-binding protein [Candidatus Magasanikbacteria bacterium]
MYKRLISIFILTILLLTTGLGCKGLNAEQQAALKRVQLEYWTIFDDVSQLQKMAAEYEKARPYVKINIRQVRYEEFDRLFTTALADDVGPDIVSMHVQWLKKQKNRLAPMPASVKMARIVVTNKYTDEKEVIIDTIPLPSVKEVKDGYVKTVYQDVVFDNKIYGLPIAMDSLGVYYNQDLLDRAGISEAPKTWDEFVKIIEKTTKFNSRGDIVQSGAALGTGNNIDASFDILSLFMLQSGVDMSQGGYVRFADGVDLSDRTHPTFRALDFYTDFARPTKKVYSWNEKMENALDAFVRGKVVFYFGYAYDYPRIKARAPQMNMKILPVFQLNPDSPRNVANYWVESVALKSKHQNEAWDFVRYITSPANVKIYTDAMFRPSPLRTQITEQQKDENMEPFATQALYAENWYTGRDIDTARDAMKTLVSELLKPYGDREEPIDRDRKLIINTAARVQQTM